MPNFNYLYENIDNKMRNLRFYENDADFQKKEIDAGGDGNSVKTSIPGVSNTWDLGKTYFNPHDEAKLTHTVTVNYKDTKGVTIAESETIKVGYYEGVEQEIVVAAKEIDGFVVDKNTKTLIIPDDSSVEFIYDGYICKPLTFNIISSGKIYWKANNSAYTVSIRYKKNNEEWATIHSNTGASAPSISVSAGDVVQFKGNNTTYCSDSQNYSNYNTFSGSTAKFEAEGNIMSLINNTNFATATTLVSSYTFCNLFSYCTGLTSTENLVLPATTLTEYCYRAMFQDCASLTTAPALPATALTRNCYQYMFSNCTSLTTAPKLPATTLEYGCYGYMFAGCTSLAQAPELPATTLASNCYDGIFWSCTSLTIAPKLPTTTLKWGCYNSMFQGCTGLTTAPELPATTLATYCYQSMFRGCTSLTTAPELPATAMADYCYMNMFSNCTNLNYIKCLGVTAQAAHCFDDWVNGVSSTGTFVKAKGIYWGRGPSGIPTNWTVQDA